MTTIDDPARNEFHDWFSRGAPKKKQTKNTCQSAGRNKKKETNKQKRTRQYFFVFFFKSGPTAAANESVFWPLLRTPRPFDGSPPLTRFSSLQALAMDLADTLGKVNSAALPSSIFLFIVFFFDSGFGSCDEGYPNLTLT